ncbi:hypothetical protein SCAR479_08547 [Seiridium cardinale]|uniref:Zn(2)-C6 fungal-type domain-containing protein n=1 Tax=Seiridium cardinale TaxID=138064 RepID=A0ABR2XM38_9PEZI
MDALLGQYGISALGGDMSRSNNGCASVDDLQRQLHHLVVSKKSDTRAEHISANFEMRANSVFYITEEQDASLAEGPEQAQNPVARTVSASQTIQNQPTDDPSLQRLVAKHLIGALGAVDASTWNVRQVSRLAQGWTFTYLCKHSLQAWNRQNANTSERPPIGAFSGTGGLDAVNLSRPAFDCRGTLTIAFSKSSRAIVVKYEHTPIHKTVAQLVDRLLPTLPPPPVANGNTPSANRSAKAKRPPPAEGEESRRKKRKKKGSGTEDTQTQNGSQPQAPVPTLNGTQVTPALNIPPLEATRRREVANKLLTDKGIDPTTLSEDQFSIFSNQAPHLQELSLDMFAKYGAERLRIVHPGEKEQSASTSSTPAQQTIAAGAGTATPATDTPSKRRKPRKKKSDAVMTEDVESTFEDGSLMNSGATEATASSRKRRTRGACNTCKLAKRKCSKEHPECSVCQERGEACVYLPPKPRQRKSGLSAEVIEGDESETVGEAEGEGQGEEHSSHAPPTPEPAAETTELMHMDSNPDDDEFIPDPNILSGPLHQPPIQPHGGPPPYYQQTDTTKASFAESSIPQPTPPTASIAASNSSRNNRRSLPTAPNPPVHGTDVDTATPAQPVASWKGPSSATALARRNSTQSPTVTQSQPTRGLRSRGSGTESNTPVFDGFQAAAVLSQTAAPMPHQRQSSNLNRSPFQNPVTKPPSRAKSRQGQRSQSRTPVTQTPVPPPVIPTSHNATASTPYKAAPTSSNATPVPTYDPFARYEGTSNDQYSQSTSAQPSRIAYGQQSYAQTTTSAPSNTYATPSYDYSRATSANNPLNQALNDSSGYSSVGSGNANQWSAQARYSQSSTPSNAYKAANRTQASPTHSHATRSSQRLSATQNSSYGQPQQQQQQQQQPSYGSYPQSSGTSQQQNANWYGFSSADGDMNNTNYATTSRNPGYGSTSSSSNTSYNQGQRPSGSDYNNTYGQDLYDMLGTGRGH